MIHFYLGLFSITLLGKKGFSQVIFKTPVKYVASKLTQTSERKNNVGRCLSTDDQLSRTEYIYIMGCCVSCL